MLINIIDKIEYIKFNNWKLHYIKYLKFNKNRIQEKILKIYGNGSMIKIMLLT